MKQFPRARQEKLVVQPFNDELLVYDRLRSRAHCLNQTAALIWQRCDGQTSVTEISRRLKNELASEAIDEPMVWYALKQFKRDHLLEEDVEVPPRILMSLGGKMTRRTMIRATSLTALVVLPLVSSINAPAAGDATSCTPGGGVCSTSATCCSGLCNNGTCV
jgi:hypothetical protein